MEHETKKKRTFTFFPPSSIKPHSCLSSLLFSLCGGRSSRPAQSSVCAVARVVGELRVGAAVRGRVVPDVQVHVGTERVEAGEVLRRKWLWSEGRHRRDRHGAFSLEVALIRLALRSPDRAEQTGGDRGQTPCA